MTVRAVSDHRNVYALLTVQEAAEAIWDSFPSAYEIDGGQAGVVLVKALREQGIYLVRREE